MKNFIKKTQFILELYKVLLKYYGPQGWWPVVGNKNINDSDGYHPEKYNIPNTPEDRFQIVVGTILTQNTSWNNVRYVIDSLYAEESLFPERILKLENKELAGKIRSSGYYNQKAIKLKKISEYFISTGMLKTGLPPKREDLLNIWGVGPETADSILLYAFKYPVFVVDAYTKRLLIRLGIIEKKYTSYSEIQLLFMDNLNDNSENRKVFNEFHALIVKHGKVHCRKTPACKDCPIAGVCPLGNNSHE